MYILKDPETIVLMSMAILLLIYLFNESSRIEKAKLKKILDSNNKSEKPKKNIETDVVLFSDSKIFPLKLSDSDTLFKFVPDGFFTTKWIITYYDRDMNKTRVLAFNTDKEAIDKFIENSETIYNIKKNISSNTFKINEEQIKYINTQNIKNFSKSLDNEINSIKKNFNIKLDQNKNKLKEILELNYTKTSNQSVRNKKMVSDAFCNNLNEKENLNIFAMDKLIYCLKNINLYKFKYITVDNKKYTVSFSYSGYGSTTSQIIVRYYVNECAHILPDHLSKMSSGLKQIISNEYGEESNKGLEDLNKIFENLEIEIQKILERRE